MQFPQEFQIQASKYLTLLETWNHVHALTALPSQARYEELLLDSLVLLPQLQQLSEGMRVVDFGSGMGVPAIPLALLRPDLEVVALDASAKKIAFIRQVAWEMKLTNVHPVQGRAEAVASLQAHAGTAKAVGTLSLLLSWWVRHRLSGAPFYAFKNALEEETPPRGWTVEAFPYDLPTRGRRVLLKLT